MKKQLLLWSLLVLTLTARAQCPTDIVNLTSQAQVDAFATTYPTCTTVLDLTIDGSSIVNLNGLSGLTSISSSLTITNNGSLTSLNGLHNLTSVGYVNIVYNLGLTNLDGLSGLTSIGTNLTILSNLGLTSLNGLHNLTSIGTTLTLSNNDALTNIEALSGLTSLQDLYIQSNRSLTSLAGLTNLTSVRRNLSITNNNLLSTCSILAICSYLANPAGSVSISGNATGCASRSEVEAACSVLPVSLVDFTANAEGTLAQLSWSTAEETQSDYFQVEHSLDGKSWRSLGRVKAQGESTSLQHYTFTDADPAQGENLYRLRIVDVDGSYAYSRLRSLRFERSQELVLYPNPVADRLRLDDWSQVQRVRLYGASGKLVQERSQGLASGLDMKPLAAGVYLVELTRTNGSVYTYRIVKN